MNNTSLSISKINTIKFLVVTVCLSLFFILGLLFGLGFFNTAYADSFGGGGSRGGGAGRKYTGGYFQRITSQGYVGWQSQPIFKSVKDVNNYGAFFWIDEGTKSNASKVGVSDVFVSASREVDYFLIFMHDNVKLGSSPWFDGSVNVEIPSACNYVIVYSKSSATFKFQFNHVAPTVEEAVEKSNKSEGVTSFYKYNNLYVDYVTLASDDIKVYVDYEPTGSYISTAYYYVGGSNPISISNSFVKELTVYYYYFDVFGNFISRGTVGVKPGARSDIPVAITADGKYLVKFMVACSSNSPNSLLKELINGNIVVSGYGDVVTGAYAIDYTSIDIVNNSTTIINNSGNIIIGDGNDIIINDGNGDINIGKPNDNKLPNEVPVVPPTDGGSDGDGSGTNWLDILMKIFDGIGNALNSLLSILLKPFDLIANLITTLLDSIGNFINSITGVTDYFGGLFGMFPSWITQPLTLVFTFTCLMVVIRLFLK